MAKRNRRTKRQEQVQGKSNQASGKSAGSGGLAVGGEIGEVGGETRREAGLSSPFPPERPRGAGELSLDSPFRLTRQALAVLLN